MEGEQSRLSELEKAENLVVSILEDAATAINDLKEIQSNETDKNVTIVRSAHSYYEKLAELKDILDRELSGLWQQPPPNPRRPGIDQLAIATWEAKVIADNLHELVENRN